MLNKLSIKYKLYLVMFVTIMGFFLVLLFNQFSSSTIKTISNVKYSIEMLEIDLAKLNSYEKDFFLSKKIKHVESFKKTYKEMENISVEIQSFFIEKNIDSRTIDNYMKETAAFSTNFLKYVEIQKELGLHPKDKLYGKLRDSVHKVQTAAKQSNNFELLSIVYDLRKQEKDFMLRKDLKYEKKFNKIIDKLLSKNYLLNDEIISNLHEYKKYFSLYIKYEVKLGLNNDAGLKGQMNKSIHASDKALIEILSESEKVLNQMTSQLFYINISIVAFIIFLIIVIMSLISKNILKSLNSFELGLNNFFKYLNREQNDVELLIITGKDEINTMAEVINKNIVNIKKDIEVDKNIITTTIHTLNEYEQGDFSLKIEEKSANPALNELTVIINKMGSNLEKNIDNILDVFESYSNNDYTKSVQVKGTKAHLEKLANGVNSLGISISSLLEKSFEIGLDLQSSSDILVTNVDILNNSSNVAASSLEETAAALEEVTSAIVSNSQNVAQLSEYAKSLSTSALHGQKLAQNTTSAMDEITNQVSLINEAISIIDQIAFQTNILSLNAAVEAATAGEAGKGFAVVAQEVRNLASRSAEAAKEIKDLVENATAKSSEGKSISDDMIKGYDSLLEDINNAASKITEITSASKEQETGITQINDAITSLDQQTQENAATATRTQEVARNTDKIAKEIVSDAMSKDFIGKGKLKDTSFAS